MSDPNAKSTARCVDADVTVIGASSSIRLPTKGRPRL
jgi:hypothetical protein